MAKDIYEIFNDRKISNIEAYTTLEEGIDALNELEEEFMMTAIETQAVFYLDNLVLENMMYEDFNEEKLVVAMEEAEEKQKRSIGEILQAQWEKLKAWFTNIIQSISNFFIDGEKLVNERGDEIEKAMKNSEIKVRMNDYVDFFEALKKVEYYLGKIKNVARQKGMSKEKLCSIIGAKDKSDVINVIKKLIIKEEGKEMKISDIDSKIAMNYVYGKKKAIELCQLLKKHQEDYFKWAKSELKDSGEDLTTFNFAVSLKNAIVTSFMKFTKKAINDYLTVIRKVLGGKSGKDKEEENNKNTKTTGGKDTTISPKFKEHVANKDTRAIRISLKNMITYDPSFNTFDVWLDYTKKNNINIFDEHDGKSMENDSSKWNKDYMNTQLVRLVVNFSKERINHLRKVVPHVYNQ